MKQIRETMPQTGTVQWIGLRSSKRGPIHVVEEASVDEKGFIGDRYDGPPDGKRMVTLILREHIDVMATILGVDDIDPILLRRNIVVSGLNLKALEGHDFQIGEVVLHGTGNCAPCSLMEENLGPGGYNSMRGHGGLTTRVVSGGKIRKGDSVKLLPKSDD